MKILLTGAKGNFGQALIKYADFKIVQLNRDGWGSLSEKLSQGIDVVIHAASDLHSRASTSPVKLMESNLVSTTRLLEAMHQHKIPRLIFLSSCAVYGEDMRTGEESLCCPISINGIGKLLNERMIAEYCAAQGIKYEILRVFNMYGGHDHFSIISYIKQAIESDTSFILNNGGIAQRDFIHVDDVARIVLQLLHKQIPYTHLNIGTGIATKISTIVELVCERYPHINISHASRNEAEYSRADISRLLELVNLNFISIEDFLRNEFMRDLVKK